MGKFSQENFRKCRKLPDGKLSPGELRDIRETSRRETFPGRTSWNPGNFSTGNFPRENFMKSGKLLNGQIYICVLYNNTLYFSIKTLSKRVLYTQHIQSIWKVSPMGHPRCFHKMRGNFLRENFPQNFRENVTTRFSRKSFPTKISYESVLHYTL
mgnify:CR=1 FL=1